MQPQSSSLYNWLFWNGTKPKPGQHNGVPNTITDSECGPLCAVVVTKPSPSAQGKSIVFETEQCLPLFGFKDSVGNKTIVSSSSFSLCKSQSNHAACANIPFR